MGITPPKPVDRSPRIRAGPTLQGVGYATTPSDDELAELAKLAGAMADQARAYLSEISKAMSV